MKRKEEKKKKKKKITNQIKHEGNKTV